MIKTIMPFEAGQTCQDIPPATNIFKQLQDMDDVWPRKPGPIVIESRETQPSSQKSLERPNPKVDPRHVRDPEQPDYFLESVVWPVSAIKEELVAPFATGGVTAFFIAPVIEPGATTAMLLTGYVVGGLVFYWQRKQIQDGLTLAQQMKIDRLKEIARPAKPGKKFILEPYDTTMTTMIIPPPNVSASTDEPRRLDGSLIV